MGAKDALNVKVYVGDGASPTENFALLGGMMRCEMQLNHAPISLREASSTGWVQAMENAGEKQMQLHVQGRHEGSNAEENLRAYALAGTRHQLRLEFADGARLQGSFIASLWQHDGVLGKAADYRVQWRSAGTLSFTAPA